MAKGWAKELKHKTAHHAADWIEQLLADGKPRVPSEICRELNLEQYRVAEGLKILRRASPPRCAVIGEWRHLAAQRGVGLGGVRKDATAYARAGTAQLPRDEFVTRHAATVRAPQARRSGSGVIAAPPYRTGFRWGLPEGKWR